MCWGVGEQETERDREWSYQRLPEVRDQKISRTQPLGRVPHAGHARKVNVGVLGVNGGHSACQTIRGQEVVHRPMEHMTGSRLAANRVSDPKGATSGATIR